MAEIRCPMCSRMNPAELDVCQFCQARLKPLILQPTPAPDPIPSNGKNGQGTDDEIPDWLRTLRERKVQEDIPSETVEQEPTHPEPVQPAEPVEPSAPEWQMSEFADLGDDAPLQNEDADWLDRIRRRTQQEQENQPEDLTSNLSWDMVTSDDPASSGDEPIPAAQEPADTAESDTSGESDWLMRLRTHPLDPNRVTGTEPDASAESEFDVSTPQAEPSPASQNDVPLSDWGNFSDWGIKLESESTPSPFQADGEADEAVPDWLQNRMNETPLSASTPEEAQPDAQPSEIPAAAEESFSTFLADIPGETAEDQPPASLPSTPESFDSLPETGPLPFAPLADEDLPPAGSSTGDVFTTDLPDWGSPVEDEPAHPAAPQDTPTSEIEFDSNSTQPMIAWEDGVLPDWLAALQSDVDEVPQQPQDPAEEEEPPAMSGALLDLGPSETSYEDVPSAAAEAELPDWLVGLGAVESTPEEEAEMESAAQIPAEESSSEGESVTDALPAELPNWVQAMRPIETVAGDNDLPQEVPNQTELSGPLAGLQGVLPGHLLGEDYKKSPVSPVQLQLNETQSRYAQILQDVIEAEGAPKPAPAPKAMSRPERLLRSIVAVIMLASILYALISNVQIMPVANLYPQEVLNVRETIEALPPDSHVLLVADYEAALAGEMEASGSAVVDHLMARSAQIAVVSTQPSGAVLASNLFDKLFQQDKTYHAAYLSGEKLAYLGYLAGGPGGMLSFTQQPRAAVPALLSNGTSVWDQPVLAGVQTLADFDLVLVMTDSADTGRAWVEQVKPALGDVPMLFVSSAQAYPVLYPYVDSQQIYGMVSGLSGGAQYEQIMQNAGLGTAYWNAYQTALLAAIALILIGGVINAILGAIKNRNPEDEA